VNDKLLKEKTLDSFETEFDSYCINDNDSKELTKKVNKFKEKAEKNGFYILTITIGNK
jgi:hypothetical protein